MNKEGWMKPNYKNARLSKPPRDLRVQLWRDLIAGLAADRPQHACFIVVLEQGRCGVGVCL